ncbi:aminodeoxychorismate/anthranilate synthase component II [Gangjinia marincola]|uniref:Aminodeoxychorismate/anthranilate synthase component II n=1 Tax=Gangjinia marincola TaxID=578463 RepID=A0ABN1MIV9_9FLAO
MKKILVIDNYDSFVYNLVHYLEELECEVTVKRNDQLYIEEVEAYDKVLLSPGPGIPDEAGLLKEIIKTYATTKPMLGVCLGHQAMGEVFGGKIINLPEVFHGVATTMNVTQQNTLLFKNLPDVIQVGRYHSWVVDKDSLPQQLEVTAVDESGQIMAFRHKELDVHGVQFHPESVLTPQGKQMIKNWVEAS